MGLDRSARLVVRVHPSLCLLWSNGFTWSRPDTQQVGRLPNVALWGYRRCVRQSKLRTIKDRGLTVWSAGIKVDLGVLFPTKQAGAVVASEVLTPY